MKKGIKWILIGICSSAVILIVTLILIGGRERESVATASTEPELQQTAEIVPEPQVEPEAETEVQAESQSEMTSALEPEPEQKTQPESILEPESDTVIAVQPIPEPQIPTEISLPPLPELDHLNFEQLWIKDQPPDPEKLQPLTDELMTLILNFEERIEVQELLIEAVEVPPSISLLQPANQPFYRSSLNIRFNVYDDETHEAGNRVESVYCDTPDGVRHILLADETDMFSIDYDSSEHKGALSIRLGAVKDNGLTAEIVLSFEEDVKGPSITLFSPEPNELIEDEIEIRGSLAPVDDSYGSVGEVESLRLYPPDSSEAIVLDFDASGDFSYTLNGLDFKGVAFLNIEAEDKNNHISVLNFPLRMHDGQIDSDLEIIRIDQPLESSLYYSQIAVQGALLYKNISEFYWSLAGEQERNSIDFSDDGSFSFRISAVDMNQDLQLLFTAVDETGSQWQKILPLMNDKRGPEILLEMPVAQQYYRETLRVKGKVEDYAGQSNEVKSLYWSVSSRPDERNLIFFEDDGTFDFEMNSDQLEGKILFMLTAADLNNNQSDYSVEMLDGKQPPLLVLSSPQGDEKYGAGITFSGQVMDPYGDNPQYGGIESLTISLRNTAAGTDEELMTYTVPLNPDGKFSEIIPVTGRSGTQDVEIRVTAYNGNSALNKMALEQSEFAIADFRVAQGDESLSLYWTEVPFIDDYTLTYHIDGESQTMAGVHSPLILNNLENGTLYSFSLNGVYGEDKVYSPTISSIPMSRDTLEPFGKSEFGFMEISWLTITGTDLFRVYRSEEGSEFIDVSGEIRDSRFVDKSGIFGREYSYIVVPSGYEEIKSYPVTAHLLSEPPKRLRNKASMDNFTPTVLKIYGDYAYVVSEEDGFYIVDISDPEQLSTRGFLHLTGGTDIHLMDDYAVITTGSTGFSLVNISEPASPRLVGSRRTNNALSVSGEGNFIYIADGEKGFKVFSLSDPLRPPRITADSTFPAYGILAEGNKLFVAAGEYGLNIYNIEDPYYPEIIGHYSDVQAYDCVVSGEYSYIATGEEGIYILNTSDPENPSFCSNYRTSEARSLSLQGNHLFIADGGGGLVDIDVTDPFRPVSFDTMSLENTTSVDVSENLLLVADKSGLKAVETFQHGQSFKIGEIQTEGSAASVQIHEGFLYISDHSGGLVVVEDSQIVQSIPTEYAEYVFISKDRLFLADGKGGVKVFAIRDELILLEQIEVTGQAVAVAVYGDRLFIAARSGGVHGIDSYTYDMTPLEAGDKERKRTADWIVEMSDSRQLAAKESYLYCADRQEGLIVLDISSPGRPERVRHIPLPGALALKLDENRLYVAHAGGITLFDVSEGAFPDEILTIESPYVEDITVEKKILYAALGHEGLSVFDIRQNQAIKVSECRDIFADSVEVSGEYAYLADSTGVNIVRIHIPQWIR